MMQNKRGHRMNQQDKIRQALADACYDGDVRKVRSAMAALDPKEVNFRVDDS